MLIRHHDTIALAGSDHDISYDELLRHIAFYKTLLNGLTGKHIVLYAENRPEWIYAFYAVISSNAVAVTVDYLSPAEDAAYIFDNSEASLIFCSNETRERTENALQQCKKNVKIICFDSITDDWQKFDAVDVAEPIDIHKTAIIIYTSGTTGKPKGVMLSWDNIFANVQSVSGEVPIYKPDQRVLLILPLHHSFPLSGSMSAPLYVGATVVLCTTLTGDGIVAALQKYKVTIFIGVPRLYSQIRKGIRAKIDASPIAKLLFAIAGVVKSQKLSRKIFKAVHDKFGGCMDVMVSGGAALDYDTAKDLTTLGFTVMEGYGMTEAGPMITCPRPGMVKIGTAGTPILHTEVRIGEDGEIMARGRNIMQGYWKRPEETAETLRDGWLHTGDLGYFDNEGYMHINGRKNELIVLSNGKNITPDQIETKLLNMSPGIADAGVYFEDNVLKVVVFPNNDYLQEHNILNIDEYIKWKVIDAYNRSVAPYKKIMQFKAVNAELPRTRLSKLQRFKLAELGKQTSGHVSTVADPKTEEYRLLKKYIGTLTDKPIYSDSHIELDLGLDSLDKVNLLVYMQKTFGLTMEDGDLSHQVTVGALASFAENSKTRMEEETVNWHEILQQKADLEIKPGGFIRDFAVVTLKIAFRLVYRLRLSLPERYPDHPFIIVCNHQSLLDWPLMMAVLPHKVVKKIFVFAKEKHFRSAFRRWFARQANIIVMDIDRDLTDGVRKMSAVLKSGYSVAIFPEGTRSKNGELGEFKKMFAILSKELSVPILPAVLKGTFRAMKSGTYMLIPFRTLKVKVLNPVVCQKDEPYDVISEYVKKLIDSELKKM